MAAGTAGLVLAVAGAIVFGGAALMLLPSLATAFRDFATALVVLMVMGAGAGVAAGVLLNRQLIAPPVKGLAFNTMPLIFVLSVQAATAKI